MKPTFESSGFIIDRLSILLFVVFLLIYGMINPLAAMEDLYETIKDMGDFAQ